VTILDFAADSRTAYGHVARAPRGVSAPRIQAAQLHDDLWRVTRPDGEVVGYVERFAESRGIRVRAKRLIVRQQRFVPIGEFWSMDDAMAVL
jgi:predicted methyltransferase